MSDEPEKNDEKLCSNCDAELPDDAEGLCPFCGTPFGLKTMVMPAITREELEKRREEREGESAEDE